MGKVEDLRKMREAQYLMRHGTMTPSKEAQEAAASLAEVGKAVREGAAERGRALSDLTDDTYKPEPAPDTSWVETVEIKDYGKCGHKGVGGKSCTRPKDHPEKNHRYK